MSSRPSGGYLAAALTHRPVLPEHPGSLPGDPWGEGDESLSDGYRVPFEADPSVVFVRIKEPFPIPNPGGCLSKHRSRPAARFRLVLG